MVLKNKTVKQIYKHSFGCLFALFYCCAYDFHSCIIYLFFYHCKHDHCKCNVKTRDYIDRRPTAYIISGEDTGYQSHRFLIYGSAGY